MKIEIGTTYVTPAGIHYRPIKLEREQKDLPSMSRYTVERIEAGKVVAVVENVGAYEMRKKA